MGPVSATINDHHQENAISGGSPISQSSVNILYVSTTDLHMNLTCFHEIDEVFNDTSWAEVFDTTWAELFDNTTRSEVVHDTSWVVDFNWNFLGKDGDEDDPDYEVPSTQRPFGRVIKFILATAATSGRPQSDDNEHPGSRLQAARFTTEPTRSRGIRPTINRQGVGWEIQLILSLKNF